MALRDIGRIRSLFGPTLQQLQVDCYTVLVQDEWQPFSYITHEVDAHLYYPEAVRAGTLVGRITPATVPCVRTRAPVSLDSLDSLSALWFSDAAAVPGISNARDLELDASAQVLFSSFAEREQIVSSARFDWHVPSRGDESGDSIPSLLFFNFRRRREFTQPLKLALTKLARDIFRHIHYETAERRKTWLGPLLKTVGVQSQLVLAVLGGLVPGSETTPGTQGVDESTDSFYRTMLASLVTVAGMARRPPAKLQGRSGQPLLDHLASLHLLVENNARLSLDPVSQYPVRRLTSNDPQPITVDGFCFTPSITCCTVLTGRTHLLNYVDGRDEVSVEIDGAAEEMLALHLPDGVSVSRTAVRAGGTEQIVRIVVKRGHLAAIDALAGSPFGAKHPMVVEKLRVRSRANFGDIYKQLDADWPLHGSEVCAPIVLCDQVIGCVNIEAREAYSLNSDILNVVTFMCGLAGVGIETRMRADLMRAINRCVEAMSPGSDKHIRQDEILFEFADAVRASLWCKEVEFLVLASNPWKKRSSYARLVTSVGAHIPYWSSEPTRAGGWTEIVGNADLDTVGAVLRLDEEDLRHQREGSTPPARDGAGGEASLEVRIAAAWWIRRGKDGRVMIEPVQEADLSRCPRTRLRQGNADCTWFFLLRLPLPDLAASSQRRGPRPSNAVLRIHHRENGTCLFEGGGKPALVRLRRYCEHALSVAEACSVVPSSWETSVSGWAQTQAFLYHGGYLQPISALDNAIRKCIEELPAGGLSSRNDLESRASLARYLWHKGFVYSNVLSLWEPQRLRAEIASAASQDALGIALRRCVEECWQVAVQLESQPEEIERNSIMLNDVDAGLRVYTSESHLRELLVQAFRNCRVHGCTLLGGLQVRVAATELRAGDVELTIDDDGQGIGETNNALPTLMEVRSNLMSGHGIGAMVMRVFAAAMGDEPLQLGPRPEYVRGTRLRFVITDARSTRFAHG